MYILMMPENPHRFILIDYTLGDVHYHANGWTFTDPDELFESQRLVPVNRNLVIYRGDIYERVGENAGTVRGGPQVPEPRTDAPRDDVVPDGAP